MEEKSSYVEICCGLWGTTNALRYILLNNPKP